MTPVIHYQTPHAEIVSNEYQSHIICVKDKATGLNIVMEFLEDGKVMDTFNKLKDVADAWQGFPVDTSTPPPPPPPASHSEIATPPKI